MTASIEPQKSILTASSTHDVAMSRFSPLSPLASCSGRVVISAHKPLLLNNLRNYYARRRPTMQPTSPSLISVSPQRFVKVRFESKVCIREIPNRRDYNKEDKKKIWTSRGELKRLMLKNHAEYVYEGRDWRNAPEEDEFGVDEDGQLIHPFHLKEKRNKKRYVLRKLPISKNRFEESSSDEEDVEVRENKRPRVSSE